MATLPLLLVPFLTAGGATGRYIIMGGVCGNDRMFCGMASGGGGCNILTVPPASSGVVEVGNPDGSCGTAAPPLLTAVAVDGIAEEVVVVVVVDDEPE